MKAENSIAPQHPFAALFNQFGRRTQIEKVGTLPVHCEVYEHSKEAPVVLFIPGLGTYSRLYCEFLAKLSECGLNVIGVDLRGHGYSGGTRGEYTVTQVVQDMKGVMDHFAARYNDQIIVFGCSMGSALAVACAEADRRVQALLCHTFFISEIPPSPFHWFGWNWLALCSMVSPQFKIDFRMFMDAKTLMKNLNYEEFVQYDQLMVWQYPIKTLGSVYSRRCQILYRQFDFKAAIISGEQDPLIHPWYIQMVTKCMRHPFDSIIIPKAGHMLPFEDVERTIEAIRKWLGKTEILSAK
ncbi:MAG: alpha/beta hydrolase [SAR324 cluster bacterium]|nr:alpha/beta hydrolase [SAR324 cluster bacterium]